MISSTTKKRKLTYADYEKVDDGNRYELINGELIKIMPPAPTPNHQDSVSNLNDAIKSFVKNHHLGKVYFSPIDVTLDKNNTVQPDILFISKERIKIIGERKIEGAPDLVIEILSPGTAYYDWLDKKELYAKFGVKEYWIVDPEKQTVEIFENLKTGFQLLQQEKETGIAKSKLLLGFKIRLEDIFAKDF